MTAQLTMNFEPGLAERHRSLKACVRERVYGNGKPLKTIASDMDLSETELTRKLADNPNDTREFNCNDLEAYITATGDVTPIYYLVEKFAVNADFKKSYAAAELAKLLPSIVALMKQVQTK
ncbi:MAG TPA: hypothetical protein VK642_13240 [Burkholderiales bacterium]|nr:hypothetical protein [Burkholderiales bacterium]